MARQISGPDAMTLGKLRRRGFQIQYLSHAEAILAADFPACLDEIERVLAPLAIPVAELVAGGGEAKATQRLRRAFTAAGWRKAKFEIKKFINDAPSASITHEIDHVRETARGTLALEIEWNNKDPFFDRDLENFKRLHAEGAISAGIILTRGQSLQEEIEAVLVAHARRLGIASYDDLARHGVVPTARQRSAVETGARRDGDFARAWAAHFKADKFGEATTHWRKLMERVERRVGHPCPLLLIGIPAGVVSDTAA